MQKKTRYNFSGFTDRFYLLWNKNYILMIHQTTAHHLVQKKLQNAPPSYLNRWNTRVITRSHSFFNPPWKLFFNSLFFQFTIPSPVIPLCDLFFCLTDTHISRCRALHLFNIILMSPFLSIWQRSDKSTNAWMLFRHVFVLFADISHFYRNLCCAACKVQFFPVTLIGFILDESSSTSGQYRYILSCCF